MASGRGTGWLLANDDTVVVAAKAGWPEYLKYEAYVCRPGRSFRAGLTHLGFYYDGAIQPLIPRIIAWFPTVAFTYESAQERRDEGAAVVADLIDAMLEANLRVEGESYGVLLLSAHSDEATLKLAHPITNDTKTAGGRNWGWTLSQRYTNIDRLTSGATVTSAL